MSFSLQKLNVVRIVETEVEKSRLIDKGFKLLAEIKEEIKEEVSGNEDPKNNSNGKDDTNGKAGK